MSKLFSKIFLPLFGLNAFISVLCAEEQKELKEAEKKLYKTDATYAEIAEDPERFVLRKDAKRCLKVINKGFVSKLAAPYEKNLPPTYSMLKIENAKKELPIIFNGANTRWKKEIPALEMDQLVTVYATVILRNCKDEQAKVPAGGSAKIIKMYYLQIDDIEVQSSAGKDASKKDAKEKEKAVSASAEDQEYEFMKYRYIDMQPQKYIGKNLRFELRFKDISNTIPPLIIKYGEISPDEYFVVLPVDTFLLPIIVKRDNDTCINTLAEVEYGSKISLCGTVKCVGDPSDKAVKPMYYVLLSSVADISVSQSDEKSSEE